MSLQITLTGQLAAEADGTRADVADLPGRQAPLVFAYLVAERDRPVPSEELAEAVWDGALPPTWRPALRGVVSKVRGFLDVLGLPADDALTSVAGCYRLALPADTAVDVEQAAGEAEAARSALAAGDLEGAAAAAERARQIAGRPLLPGHEGGWVERRRAGLQQVLVDSLEVLVDVHLRAGQPDPAVGPARDLVALEPFRDSAHERLLRAHAAVGDRGEALRAYDRYRRTLAEELGVGPSPGVEAIYLELLHAEPRSPGRGAGQPSAAPVVPVTGAFVGRRPQLDRLRSAWADATAGRRRTVLMAGEAGIGKTRLAAHLATLAERDGGVVLAGRCDQHLGVPYLPLREALGRHLGDLPDQRLRSLLGPRATELVRLWPELAWRLPRSRPPGRTGPPADPYLLGEALVELLEAVADGGPVLLLVDDLHGADEATLLLLRGLAHAPRPAGLLTLLIYRDDEPGGRESLPAALADLLRAPGAELLTLDGLATEEVAALAAATVGRPLGADGAAVAAVLRERTGGNPFLAGELLRHLAERGGLAGPDLATVAVGPAVHDVPDSVRSVVGQRLARLGGPVQHVLAMAAVIGRRFDLATLGRVVDVGHDSLLAAVDTAVAARLLDERPGGAGRYAFHHALVRDLLYRDLPAGERARAHRRVGEALEAPAGGATRLGELADHFALAGNGFAERAAGYARRAAEQAAAGHGHEEAAHRYRQALAALDRSGAGAAPADLERRCDLLLDLARAWTAAGQAGQAAEAYLRAADTARAAGSAGRLAEAALGLGTPAAFWSAGVDRDRPVRLLREALAAVGPEDGGLRARLLARLAGWRAAPTALGPARPQDLSPFPAAVAMARRVAGDPGPLAAALADQELAWSGARRPGGPGAALAATGELERLAADLGDDGLALRAGLARAGALLAAGDLEAVDRLAGQAGRVAAERRLPARRWLALTLRASGAAVRGRFADGERLLQDALEAGRDAVGPAAASAYGAQLVILRWLQGRPAELASILERLAAQPPPAGQAWAGLLPLAYAGRSRDADGWAARRHLDAALAGDPGDAGLAGLVALTSACAQVGDTGAAGRLAGALGPWAGHHLAAGPVYLGSADHHLGVLAGTAGRWKESARHFQVALTAYGALGARPWQARACQGYAAMLRARGRPDDRGRAAAVEGTAQAMARLLGMALPGG
jgi:DNA-binding SARP family transcriptional activator